MKSFDIRTRMIALVTAIVMVALLAACGSYVLRDRAAAAALSADRAEHASQALHDTRAQIERYGSLMQQSGFCVAEGEGPQAQGFVAAALPVERDVEHRLNSLRTESAAQQVDAIRLEKLWRSVHTSTEEWLASEAVVRQVPLSMGSSSVPGHLTEMPAVPDDEGTEVTLTKAQNGLDTGFVAAQAALASSQSEASAQAKQLSSSAWTLTLAGILGIALFAAVLGGSIVSGIVRRLRRAEAYALSVASGDLDAAFGEHADDEIGHMTAAMEAMTDTLVNRMRTMQEVAGAVLVTSEDLAATATAAHEALGETQPDAECPGTQRARSEIERITSGAGLLAGMSRAILDA